MSAAAAFDPGASPFTPRAALALVAGGAALFVLLLWLVGAGFTGGSLADGGGHVGGTGLNGFAGLARYLEARGLAVRRSRSEAALKTPGLLVLTPSADYDGATLDRIVARRRLVGPTLVIGPKWAAMPLSRSVPGARKGWVALVGTGLPVWKGFLDEVTVALGPASGGGWAAKGLRGVLPVADKVETARGDDLAQLAVTGDRRMLAGYVDDANYPALAALAPRPARTQRELGRAYPLALIFEPDLVDNYGLEREANALFADRLVRALRSAPPAAFGQDPAELPVTFDLTLAGFARSPNLLTLAFTPPFVAATACLLLAALAAGWRGFVRFGPPRAGPRAIAFGKRALLANSAGLIVQGRRLHLVALPYAARARDRLAGALGLPRGLGPDAIDAAIDRALARRDPTAPAFSRAAATLVAAARRDAVLAAARQVHGAERTLVG